MATRIVRRETRKRGFFGWAFLLIFLGFNILMLWAFVNTIGAVDQVSKGAVTDAQRAGHAIGAGIGFTVLLVLWAAGAVITGLLALLTRGRKTIVEEYDA